jgi:hypothetical protein
MVERLNSEVNIPELSKSDIDDEELRQLVATHGGPSIGQVVIKSLSNEVMVTMDITYDHQKIGEMLTPTGNHGFAQLEDVLYGDLSDEQEAKRKQIQAWINDPEIDLL